MEPERSLASPDGNLFAYSVRSGHSEYNSLFIKSLNQKSAVSCFRSFFVFGFVYLHFLMIILFLIQNKNRLDYKR
jgi:hypothetical protein